MVKDNASELEALFNERDRVWGEIEQLKEQMLRYKAHLTAYEALYQKITKSISIHLSIQ